MPQHKVNQDSERELAPDVEPVPAPEPEHDDAERAGHEHVGAAGAAGVAVRRRGGGAGDPLGGAAIGDDLDQTLRRRSGGGRPLPADLASSYGAAYGADLSGVRVHDDSEAHSIARSVQSVAFTHGQDVYFSPGAYAPGGGGDHTLAHELAHVAQQATGRDGGAAGTIGRADDPAEADADRMAGSALSGLRRMAATTPTVAGPARAGGATVRRLVTAREMAGEDEKDGDDEAGEVEDTELLDEAVGGAGAMFDDEEKRGERRSKDGGGLTDEAVGGVGQLLGDEEKRHDRANKGGGGLTDDVVGGVGTMLDDEEKRGERSRRRGGGGITDESVDGVGKLMGDEEKRSERRERRKKGGGLTDDVVGGTGGMFADEEKRGQRRRRKGGGGITGDSVEGVGTMIEDEQKIADKRDERRRRKQRGGLTLGSAADVAELFDLQDRDWFTDDVAPNPQTAKVHLPAGTKVVKVVGGVDKQVSFKGAFNVSPKPSEDRPGWMAFTTNGTTYYVEAAKLVEDPALAHVRDDLPVFPLDAKGDPIPPKAADVQQYGLGDCYLEAALASLAETNPDQIVGMIKDFGNTATVRLYDVKRDKVTDKDSGASAYKANTPATFTQKLVRVEKSRVREGDKLQYDAGALWVGLIEKAYTAGQFAGREAKTDNARKPGQKANYADIEGGQTRYAWEVLLGRPSLRFDVTQGAEQDARNSDQMPWSDHELEEYRKNAKKIFGSSYSGLASYHILDQNKKRVDAWVKWLKGGGQVAIDDLFEKMVVEWNGGYENGTIRVEDFELIFADNGLAADVATPMLTYLEGMYPGKRGTGKYTRDQLRLWHQIAKAIQEKNLVSLDTHQSVGRVVDGVGKSGGEAKAKGIAGGHAYSVLGTEVVGDLKYVKIRNPWGSYSRTYDQQDVGGKKKLTPKAVDGGDGISMIELSDVTKRFSGVHFS